MREKKRGLLSKFLDLFFPPPPDRLSRATRLLRGQMDEDVAFCDGLAQPEDKRPDVDELVAKQFAKDGTKYGHKPYPGAKLGRELDRRAAIVQPCTSAYPEVNGACGHFCGGPTGTIEVASDDGFPTWINLADPPKA